MAGLMPAHRYLPRLASVAGGAGFVTVIRIRMFAAGWRNGVAAPACRRRRRSRSGRGCNGGDLRRGQRAEGARAADVRVDGALDCGGRFAHFARPMATDTVLVVARQTIEQRRSIGGRQNLGRGGAFTGAVHRRDDVVVGGAGVKTGLEIGPRGIGDFVSVGFRHTGSG